ncbi:MAG: Flp pilus assembly protein CpaB [Desulfoarculaceae bacterium]|nr:Flp pilus assembly protein CpaB [Desulfoarculaceae bacterium]
MNRSARILFLVVTLVVASLVSYVVYQRTATQPVVSGTESTQKIIQIAVVDRNLGRGTLITAQDLRMAPYLEETVPKGHFTDLNKGVDRVVIKPLQATEPLLESALAATDLKKGGMAAVITSQKRAMAVKVDEVIGVAGFLHPGHLVDVLVSVEEPGEKRTQITKTVLQNILVLSVGTQAQESDDKTAKRVTVVTLEVDLEEAEKLALAVNQGSIQLALRGYSDIDEILTRGITVPTLLKSYATTSDEPVKVSQVSAAAPPPRRTVAPRPRTVIEVMNGNQVQKLIMSGN